MKSVEEADVGILCYISQLPGFRGILKQRYSDFIVNEVGLDENVAHLTSLVASPEDVVEKKIDLDDLNRSYETELELFKSLVGDSDAACLKVFIDQISAGSNDSVDPIILSPSSDKAHRTEVHNFFKTHFKILTTDTVDGPDTSSKCIRVWLKMGLNNDSKKSKKRKERGAKQYHSRGSDDWPDHLDKFLSFNLYKENKDTQEVLGLLGKMLGNQTRSFGFAGTKDKRAVTTQRVTVFKQRASRLAALNEKLIGIRVGDFCYVKEGLQLGQLYGNRFTITLRGIDADSENTITSSAKALGQYGFINYFGLQRFGSSSVPTHLIGAALLRGEWKTAVNLVLDPREGERDVIQTLREYYKESGDIDGTLRQLPRYLVAERAILQCLKKFPGNYLQALKAIPRTLRMMYVHSYQSYLWNHAASMRVQKHGFTQVVLGDLVICKEESKTSNSMVEFVDDVCSDRYENSHIDESSEVEELPAGRCYEVKVVSEQDLASGAFKIDDIVLPLPGSKTVYPTNDIGDLYHDLAKKDAISLTESVHTVKEFSITNMKGDYRRVFQKPENFEWELIKYTDCNVPLAETDLDVISRPRSELSMGERETINENEERKQEETLPQKVEPQNDSNGAEVKLALKLSLTLPASCYATMAIRELLKTSTSVAFHKTLND
ncbi:multisubstrate pseudouridine synthase 7 [Impatiens glandulifera]|uniref:multisubstrate pseudouridine synthase 7 n=1 Tax=Impatiens glandulifera TaxID=253017 RepID=UPI001FB0D9B8|nr:multisubstrate pseudouridine synthase 7 [Impatiens glandulifera]